MNQHWNFFSAGEILFGDGVLAQLPAWLTSRYLRRLLLITDARLVEAGLVEQVIAPLKAAGCEVKLFAEGEPEPSVAVAERAGGAAKAFGPQAILGLGGGSNLDLAKITAIVAAHGGKPRDYFGFDRVPGPVAPLVAIPTTAGTGSEVSHAAVLTDHEAGIKVSSLSRHLRPAMALVDPELTYTCPPRVTADSGMDALTHAIEAYTAAGCERFEAPPAARAYTGKSPLADCLAEQAIRLIGRHLLTAFAEPENAEARHGMALAALTAGLAFSNAGVAVVHALEYPLGATLHVSHGGGNAMLLPHVMRYNAPERAAELARVAEWLGAPVAGLELEAAAEQAAAAVETLNRKLGIPAGIKALGGTREQLPGFAEKSFAITRLMETNPRRPKSAAELLTILEAAFDPAQ